MLFPWLTIRLQGHVFRWLLFPTPVTCFPFWNVFCPFTFLASSVAFCRCFFMAPSVFLFSLTVRIIKIIVWDGIHLFDIRKVVDPLLRRKVVGRRIMGSQISEHFRADKMRYLNFLCSYGPYNEAINRTFGLATEESCLSRPLLLNTFSVWNL